MAAKKANVKKRNWAMVVYPESAPENWLEILAQTGLQCAVSPLHDKDVNANGETKKPHWHVIVCYSGPTSYSVVCGLTSKLNAPAPQALEQVKGYYRYLTHMDNPEKAQYDPNDIRTVNGFNIMDYADLTRSEVDSIKFNLLALIRTESFTEYADLMDFLQDNGMMTEFGIASSNTIFFNSYISSRRNKVAGEQNQVKS